MTRLATSGWFEARFTATEFLRMAEASAFEGMTVELVGGEL
ncbi:hypothetical protein [Sphingomonas abaci]|uniref:Uncharacterized protein n=1 Tax=Sphingomonas abaci TaxID=237611 RepID=A0A7W7F0C6_9SPHN|nr:hypothetical protein [Sphingomonas abaci]MBB4618230.1 hypothetical protein [Sphingomonas abaci]